MSKIQSKARAASQLLPRHETFKRYLIVISREGSYHDSCRHINFFTLDELLGKDGQGDARYDKHVQNRLKCNQISGGPHHLCINSSVDSIYAIWTIITNSHNVSRTFPYSCQSGFY